MQDRLALTAWSSGLRVLARALAIASTLWLNEAVSPVNVSSIGEYIRQQREQAKISLRQLASAAGVSNPYLSQIERGLRRPSAEILQQIAKGLRISAEALYVQAGILEDRRPDSGVRAAVLADPELAERQKQVLLEIYESFRREIALNAQAPAAARLQTRAPARALQAPSRKRGRGSAARRARTRRRGRLRAPTGSIDQGSTGTGSAGEGPRARRDRPGGLRRGSTGAPRKKACPFRPGRVKSVMNRTMDVRTEMRKLADSKPVHAAAGAGVLASETLRELTARLAKWRDEASVEHAVQPRERIRHHRPHAGIGRVRQAGQARAEGPQRAQHRPEQGRDQRPAQPPEPPAVQQVLTLGPPGGIRPGLILPAPGPHPPADRPSPGAAAPVAGSRRICRWLSAHIVTGPDNLEGCSPLEL